MLSPVDEIKNRLNIVDFISTYVPLKRAGANFSAKCPFHSEKTPSFMVSQSKQLWYCFGACSEGGDVFKFLMKIEGLEFPEALKILADKAGVQLPKYDKQAESKKNTLLDIMKDAVAFYAVELNGPRGVLAREYLQKRGLSEAVIKQFSLGYAPDLWDALTGELRDKFKAEDVFAAGLTVKRTTDYGLRTTAQAVVSSRSAVDRYYDRFRHRIMFPIRDIHGNPVGFTSRLLDETRAEGKYVNTPETLIYNKSRVLYGLDLAREAIRRNDHAVIVEGNMDVIACNQFGMTNVVAASGTALTLDHARLLKRYTSNVKIAFDADPAGENAAKRGIDIALGEGMRVKVVIVPSECGKDPDECIRKDVKMWEGAVRDAKEIMDYYLEKARARFDVSTAQGRSQFVNTLLAEATKLPDLVEQDFWLKKVGEIVRVDEKLLREQMSRVVGRQKTEDRRQMEDVPSSVLRPPSSERPRAEILSERLLALFIASPARAEEIIGAILPEMLSPAIHQELYGKLVTCYTAYNSPGSALADADFRQFWRTWLTQNGPEMISTADPDSRAELHCRASILEMLGDKEFEGWDSACLGHEAQFLIAKIRHEYLRRRRVELALQMREAEARTDGSRVAALAQEFEELSTME